MGARDLAATVREGIDSIWPKSDANGQRLREALAALVKQAEDAQIDDEMERHYIALQNECEEQHRARERAEEALRQIIREVEPHPGIMWLATIAREALGESGG